uniref:tRNA (32-2'-O)-methyltransferase regulator THADA-like TPR repeats region domain-containing protein n=1 Tax=Ditylenchus dipsaci TaxID=166011 RepID=A0A915ENA0_9BILA
MICQDVTNFTLLLSKADPSWSEPCCSVHSSFLQDFCLPSLVKKCQLESSNPQLVYHSVICITRVTTVISEKNVQINNATQQLLLHLINQFLDYQLEVVGYKILDILDNLLTLHCDHCQDCAAIPSTCQWLDGLKQNLMDISCLSRCRLNALCRLTTHSQKQTRLMLSTEFFDQLYAQLGNNPALDSGISALICQDICNTYERNSFHVQMIKQKLLSDSLEVRSAIEKRFLVKKLQNAQFRHWFIDNYFELSNFRPTSKHSLEARLMLTKMAVIHQKTLSLNLGWADYMSAKSLQAGLFSNSFDIKLAAWNLLCDHPKTSRPVCSAEFILAKQFIASNLVEQQPSSRTQIIGGLRKLFERMRESSRQLFKKKCMEESEQELIDQYTHFLTYFLELAFDALGTGSNFNRRISALHILKLILCGSRCKGGAIGQPLVEHFNLTSWLVPTHFNRLLAILDDDYEICQLAALEIAAQINFSHDPLVFTASKIGIDCLLPRHQTKSFCLQTLF